MKTDRTPLTDACLESEDLRRVVAMACTEEDRSDEEQAALVRVAMHVDERMRSTGTPSHLEQLAKCTRAIEENEQGGGLIGGEP